MSFVLFRLFVLLNISSLPVAASGHAFLDYLCQVQRLATGCLGDLVAAAEAIRYDPGIPFGFPDLGQQDALAHLHRDVVVLVSCLESEASRHPTAPRVGKVEFDSHLAQDALLSIEAHDALVVTVPLDDRADRQFW